MRPLDLLLSRTRTAAAEARAALKLALDSYGRDLEKGHGDHGAAVQAAGEHLRDCLAELKGAEAAALASRQGGRQESAA